MDPQDILIVPLIKPDGKPLGLISIDAPRNNLRPDKSTIETLEIFSSQAALAIESQQRITDLQFDVTNLGAKIRSERTSSSRNIPGLSNKTKARKLPLKGWRSPSAA